MPGDDRVSRASPHLRLPRRADVGGDASARCGAPAVGGFVAGDIKLVVIERGSGAPVSGDRAAAGGSGSSALGAGPFGGALVPPLVVDADDDVAEPDADGLGVAIDQGANGLLAGSGRPGEAG